MESFIDGEIIKKYSEKIKLEEEKKEKMINLAEYMEWISEFTKERECFYDKEFDINSNISSEDLKKTKLLDKLFNIISLWAERNYIENETPNSFTFYYNIEYDGIIYEIGLNVAQGGNNWIRRIDIPTTEVIHFDEVKNNALRSRTKEIDKKLMEFQNYLFNLIDEGVPEVTLKYELEKSIKGRQKILK